MILSTNANLIFVLPSKLLVNEITAGQNGHLMKQPIVETTS
jgi:hypothetical protein